MMAKRFTRSPLDQIRCEGATSTLEAGPFLLNKPGLELGAHGRSVHLLFFNETDWHKLSLERSLSMNFHKPSGLIV